MRVSGFEPESLSWQPRIITWLYYTRMESGVGFEPTVLRICNPLQWAALPPRQHIKTGQGRENRTPTSSIQDSSTTTILFPENCWHKLGTLTPVFLSIQLPFADAVYTAKTIRGAMDAYCLLFG